MHMAQLMPQLLTVSCFSRVQIGFGFLVTAHLGSPGKLQPFNGLFSRTTRVSRYQKGKTNLDFTEARDSEWQWHQPGYRPMQVCTSLQRDSHASTVPLMFFTGRLPFLPPNQQRQSTEGIPTTLTVLIISYVDSYSCSLQCFDAVGWATGRASGL